MMKIKINGISDEIIIGCYQVEKDYKQPIIMDLECELFECNKDELDNTVDYVGLASYAKLVLSEKQFNLLESLSKFIATEILKRFVQIKSVMVTLVKTSLYGLVSDEIKLSYSLVRKFLVGLALGSNDSNLPEQQIVTAIELLGEYLDDISIGSFYKTSPVGYTPQNDFINTAITGFTSLTPEKLFSKIKTIEKLMGKVEKIINGPRIIDIDIIFFDDLIYQHNYLRIPHRYMHKRDFVLIPLAEIAPNWEHPEIKKTIIQLRDEISANNILEKVEYK